MKQRIRISCDFKVFFQIKLSFKRDAGKLEENIKTFARLGKLSANLSDQ